ncbi:MAG TPA: hypothetical protein VED17_05120 [Nitrososphaerales archaeon]|nr:hypothetical protein [Nitrososphaerales archaeon]
MPIAPKVLVLASLAVLFLSMAVAVVPAFAASAPEFASYRISGSGDGHSFSAVANETVAPSSASGMSDVTLQIGSAMQNLSYSKIMNASQVILPYFPTISNQSLTYQFHNFSISASINQAGSASASYNGQSYSLSNFTFSVSVSGSGHKWAGSQYPAEVTGSALVFPSGLVYSASIVANGTDAVSVQLLATNLSLTSQSGSSQMTTTSIAVAGGAASILVGVGAFVVYRRKNNSQSQSTSESKPLYHVD